MNSKIKNIILFTIATAFLILAYMFFFKKAPDQQNLVSTDNTGTVFKSDVVANQTSKTTEDLLSVLLSVRGIKLDDSIFSDEAFLRLKDSSIFLNPPTDEGRPNPFAPIGTDNPTPAVNTGANTGNSSTKTN